MMTSELEIADPATVLKPDTFVELIFAGQIDGQLELLVVNLRLRGLGLGMKSERHQKEPSDYNLVHSCILFIG
jgi:hypothetical protein